MSDKVYVAKLPKISSQIINEAKAALSPSLYVKPLTTNRPFTPRERIFFCHRRTNRPPTAFKYVKMVLKLNMVWYMHVCVYNRLQNVQPQEKKKTSCTKLPALDKSKYYYTNDFCKIQQILLAFQNKYTVFFPLKQIIKLMLKNKCIAAL